MIVRSNWMIICCGVPPDFTRAIASARVWAVGFWPPMVAKSAFAYSRALTPLPLPCVTIWKSRLRTPRPPGFFSWARADPSSAAVGRRLRYSWYSPSTVAI
jgi:hypothetical protein